MVCLVFIFVTPKGWFDNGERPNAVSHPSAVLMTVFLGPEVVVNESDTSQIEQQVRSRTGRSDAKVLGVRKVVGDDGRTRGFEVDIQ